MSHGHHEEAHAHEPVGYGSYFITWFALVFLTAITVTAAGLHLAGWWTDEPGDFALSLAVA